MIKNNFYEVHPPVIAVQEKLLATQSYNLTHLSYYLSCLNLTFDLYEGHMIKNNFFEVHPPVIAVQEKLLATQSYNLTHLSFYRKHELIRFWEQSLEKCLIYE